MKKTLVNMMQSMEDKATDCDRNSKAQFASAKNVLILLGRVTLLFTFLYLSFLMLAITFQYIPMDLQVAFLATKQHVIQFQYYQIAFFSHVYSSIFILILGSTQFIESIRRKYPLFHRYFGLTYVMGILCISAPSGFVMGIHGNGGYIAQSSFCILSILWFYYTLQSFLEIQKRNIIKHRNYMILSYALTLSALTLRLHKYILANTTDVHRLDIYRIVSWSGWVINLVIAYAFINRNTLNKVISQRAE